MEIVRRTVRTLQEVEAAIRDALGHGLGSCPLMHAMTRRSAGVHSAVVSDTAADLQVCFTRVGASLYCLVRGAMVLRAEGDQVGDPLVPVALVGEVVKVETPRGSADDTLARTPRVVAIPDLLPLIRLDVFGMTHRGSRRLRPHLLRESSHPLRERVDDRLAQPLHPLGVIDADNPSLLLKPTTAPLDGSRTQPESLRCGGVRAEVEVVLEARPLHHVREHGLGVASRVSSATYRRSGRSCMLRGVAQGGPSLRRRRFCVRGSGGSLSASLMSGPGCYSDRSRRASLDSLM